MIKNCFLCSAFFLISLFKKLEGRLNIIRKSLKNGKGHLFHLYSIIKALCKTNKCKEFSFVSTLYFRNNANSLLITGGFLSSIPFDESLSLSNSSISRPTSIIVDDDDDDDASFSLLFKNEVLSDFSSCCPMGIKHVDDDDDDDASSPILFENEFISNSSVSVFFSMAFDDDDDVDVVVVNDVGLSSVPSPVSSI